MHYTHDPEIRAQNRGPVMIAVVVVLLCLSTTMVGLRILCRSLIKGFGLDDLAAVLTLVGIIGSGSAMIAMTNYGLGRHDWTLTPATLILYARCFWVSVLFYMMALFWAKMTFLLHYYRLMSVSNMRNVYLGAIIIVALWGLSQTIMAFTQCIPLKAVWDPRVEGWCRPHQTTLWYINGVINIVSDFAILILPLPVIWKLQLPLSQKILLSGIFGLGLFTIAVSILRMQWLKPSPDMTWWNVTAASWSLAELTSAITCACLPTFKPLVVRIKPLFSTGSKGDSTVQLQESFERDTESNMKVIGSQDRFTHDHKKPSRVYMYGTETHITATQDSRRSRQSF
ncbi:Hypothetical protein NCS54_00324700 [Fusarium falciforme]|uniref:Hypothetical protein n=1 Tax=Fusarium falciforme TaxID=195108 RepID=UPI002301606B|nr:Hypothetical protein NCS54_00324700 [Fusarium falciforme]WAO85993.1 Hypothetical protein NCS54_00324700 [Fusarium falciforme]